jgi:hypothetical protein
MPGAQPHPQPRVQNKKAHERSRQTYAETFDTPCAMILAAYTCSPVYRAFWSVPIDTDIVCLSGKTGSDLPTVKATFLTRKGRWNHALGLLDFPERDAERVNAHVGAGGDHGEGLKLLAGGIYRLASSDLREAFGAFGHEGGVGERLIGHTQNQGIGLPVDFVPVFQQKRSLDSVASEPEMVVANAALRQQRFSGS